MRRPIRAWGLAFSLTVIACRTWQAQPGPPRNDIQWAVADTVNVVRVVLTSGATTDLYRPSLSGDSIVGMSSPARERVAFALTDVRSVARYNVDSGKTALAIAGLALGVLAVMAIAAVVALSNGLAAHR